MVNAVENTINAQERRLSSRHLGSSAIRSARQVSTYIVAGSTSRSCVEGSVAYALRARTHKRQPNSPQQAASLDDRVDCAMRIPKYGGVVKRVRVKNEQVGESSW